MKRLLLLLFAAAATACGGPYGAGIPAEYEPLLDAALADAPRADSLRALLQHMIEKGLSSEERQAGIWFARDLGEIRCILAAHR